MSWKETYTKIFLKQAGKSINEVSLKEHLPIWWHNTRAKDKGGLRLTDVGFTYIKEEIDIQTYEIPYPADFELTTQTIIFLDKFIDCPYYLGRNTIHVLDEKKAVELTMFSGDIRKYGLTKALQRQESKDNG